jgi:hypothetical protein
MVIRPPLHPYPLTDALACAVGRRGAVIVVTMSEGQWDAVLASMYEQDAILLELDTTERPVRAYRKADSTSRPRLLTLFWS